jgi:hypothetical protein
MPRKCSKKQSYIKSYKRSNGVKVKGHCSNKKGRSRKQSRKQSRKRSQKLRCSPPKSQHVKSYKRRGGKRVKAHCSRPKRSFLRRLAELQAPVGSVRQMLPFEIPSVVKQEESKCTDLNQTECVQVLDENNLRRCRVNIQSKACEDLPLQFRERATYQVGGSAEYKPYVAGERMKLSEEKLAPFRVEEYGRRDRGVGDRLDRRYRAIMEESQRLIEEGKRRSRQ